ncbi:tyrosyl-DNA phosphodiesterase 2 [Pelobates cultripes]|uniref:Tyrosyl-DNA phosphodiesterase 2 n=2 Tax=Pelobates cultripes TaxID=61616 RepID=A0AAD1S105_PELCU|nr:tyrosyl-DNA phosphodiesterase 2 [Pelobates cultripes]
MDVSEELRAEEGDGGRVTAEREQRCVEFAGIAGCDRAVAQCFLAENDWDMERAINSYFEPGVDLQSQDRTSAELGDPSVKQSMPVTSESCIDLTNDELLVNIASSGQTPETQSLEDEGHFSFLTWNIDGLDESNLQERARSVCSYLALYSPDIVLLQEVIPPYYAYLKKRAVSYTIIAGNDEGYFTAIMLKNSRVKLISQEIVPYPNTTMMRNLLIANVNLSGNHICLMTSHLESTKDHSKERLAQLHVLLKKMQEAPLSATVIYGGDTNLRDSEVQKIGGLPSNILDVWEFLGKPEHCRYTWDTKVNNNLRAPYTCRLRFDRILYRASGDGSQVIPNSLDLVGVEKLDCGRYPSDHWGLLCDFDVVL